MSGICGWVGDADPAVLDAMLEAIDYRGDRTDKAMLEGAALGYRWWSGRPGKSPGIYREGGHAVACAGTFAPPVASSAAELMGRMRPGPDGLDAIDGAFAAAWWDAQQRRLTLIRDPFGVRSLLDGRLPGIRTRRGVKIWLLVTLEAWLRGVLQPARA